MLLDRHSEKETREWERVRFLVFHNYQSVIDWGNQPWKKTYKKLADIIPLSSDKNIEKEVKPDFDRAKSMFDRVKAIKQQRDGDTV